MKQAHLPLLRCFDELPFYLGKKTFIEFLKGNPHPTIQKNSLDELSSFGCLYIMSTNDIENLIEALLDEKYLEFVEIQRGISVLQRTKRGASEILKKEYNYSKKKTSTKHYVLDPEPITATDREVFKHFEFFLKKCNNEQKKAVVSAEKSILCVAGAGSGKTLVLTKRIDFLVKFRGVNQKEILAITFTRKARDEMLSRLERYGIKEVKVETFNSFCEKILKKYGHKFYGRDVRVIQYRDKIALVRESIRKNNLKFEVLAGEYFSRSQLREKSSEELFFLFVNDMFSLLDFYKNTHSPIMKFFEKDKSLQKKNFAKKIYLIVNTLEVMLKEKGLRDFSDQVIDTIELFGKFPEYIPEFKHILIDEYQDINACQHELMKKLNSENLFAVGDPRQAIYGWRGSDISFILNFPKEFQDTQILALSKNYRSSSKILSFFNRSIAPLGFSELEAFRETPGEIFLFEKLSEKDEITFVTQAIKSSNTKRSEIFVLARTHRALEKFALEFSNNGIQFIIKSEEELNGKIAQEDQVTLATIHSIKGLEANDVYLVGVNNLNFPNKVQDNKILALVKSERDYNKESEERRLFYVALSRAKEKLILTYTGTPSKFITDEMMNLIDVKKTGKTLRSFISGDVSKEATLLKSLLREWRSQKARETDLPLYMILSNKAIEDLARYIPQTKEEMYPLNGLGDITIAKYGDELLRVLHGQ